MATPNTAPTIPTPAPRAASGPRPLPTLTLLRAATAVVFASTAIFWHAASSAIDDSKRSVTDMTRETAPAIDAALVMRCALARAEAHGVRALAAPSGRHGEWAACDRALAEATEQTLAVARRASSADERSGLATAVDRASRCAAFFAVLRAGGGSLDAATNARQAVKLVRTDALPATVALGEPFRVRHAAASRYANRPHEDGFVAAAGLALVAIAAAQAVLAVRFRRLVSPWIVAASLVAFAGMVQVESGLADARFELGRTQRGRDALDALANARAELHEARADETLALLLATDAEDAFVLRLRSLAGSGPQRGDALHAAFTEIPEIGADFERSRGECEAAHDALRAVAASGGSSAALEVLTLPDGAAVATTERVDAALGRALEAHRNDIERSGVRASLALEGLARSAAAASIGAAVLCWFGLRARMKEFDPR